MGPRCRRHTRFIVRTPLSGNHAWEFQKRDLDGAAREYRAGLRLNQANFRPMAAGGLTGACWVWDGSPCNRVTFRKQRCDSTQRSGL